MIASRLRKDITVSVPITIMEAIDQAIPRPKHLSQIKAANSARKVVLWYLNRLQYEKDGTTSINQKLLNRIVPSGQRDLVKRGLDTFQIRTGHFEPGLKCFDYRLHDGVSCMYASTDPTTRVPYSAIADRCHPASCYRQRLSPADNVQCIDIVLDKRWVGRLCQRVEKCMTRLWRYDNSFRNRIAWSLRQCKFSDLTADDALNYANETIARKASLSVRKRVKVSAEKLASIYLRQWHAMLVDPMHFCGRQSMGRVYYPICNQPKAIRRDLILFDFQGDVVPGVEVDLSSSYFVFLASIAGCPKLQLLCHEGVFYEALADACSSFEWTDRNLLKISAQIQCLFGHEDFGRQPLFGALHSISPRGTAAIRRMRRFGGPRSLSMHLMRAEAQFFIDLLLPALRRMQIPALPIHDGVIVPVTAAEKVAQTARNLMTESLGFSGKFAIKS